jgi:hypothetical protein
MRYFSRSGMFSGKLKAAHLGNSGAQIRLPDALE